METSPCRRPGTTELQHLRRFYPNSHALLEAPWLFVRAVTPAERVNDLLSRIDLGEAEALVLTEKIGAESVLIDEREGRRIAPEMGLTPVGTLGILRQAKQACLVSVVKPAIEQLQKQLSFRLSPKLVARFLESIGEA